MDRKFGNVTNNSFLITCIHFGSMLNVFGNITKQMFIGHDFVYKTPVVLTIRLPERFFGNVTKRFSTTYLVMQPRALKSDFPHLHVCPGEPRGTV